MITLDTLTLPDNLVWSDEFSWAGGVAESREYTIQGKLIIQASAVQSGSGRPVTLSGDWISREDLLTLQEWAGDPDKTMVLTLHDGRSFEVRFRHSEAPVIEAPQVHEEADPVAGTEHEIESLKLEVL